MKRASLHALLIVVTILTFKPEARPMEQQELLIFDFKNSEKREHWRIINDGVMGGCQNVKSLLATATQPFLKESFLWKIMVVLHRSVQNHFHMI